MWSPTGEDSIWSSKYDQTPNKMRERMSSGPSIPQVKKTRIQAILTALPVLMLAGGLLFQWHGDRRQANNPPIIAQQLVLDGAFDRITPRGDKARGKHYLWLRTEDRTRPIRLTYEQKRALLQTGYTPGELLVVTAAPSVAGSTVLWLVQVSTRQ